MLPNNIELRKGSDDLIDDIVVKNPSLFRMEYQDNGTWWIGVYSPNGDLVIRCRVIDWPIFEVETKR